MEKKENKTELEVLESTKTIKLTATEAEAYAAFKAEREAKAESERKEAEKLHYRELVDSSVNTIFSPLNRISKLLTSQKMRALETFETVIEMKAELFNIRSDQKSNTFTNNVGDKRITIGNYVTDSYSDTVNEGIAIVREAVNSYIHDVDSKALVDTILRLLAKDKKGNLKPGSVMLLRKTAEQVGNDRLMEGIQLIEDSYTPTPSKTFIRVEYRNRNGAWVSVPLGITEA